MPIIWDEAEDFDKEITKTIDISKMLDEIISKNYILLKELGK